MGNIGGAGENELNEVRGRRDRLSALIYASAFENTLSSEAAQQESEDSSPIGTNVTTQLNPADEIADVRFTYAKDVAIRDRLVKEIEIARRDQLRLAMRPPNWKAMTMNSTRSGLENGRRSDSNLSRQSK